MSTSPDPRRAALPLEDPPAINDGLCGFLTGSGYDVCEPPDTQRFSHLDLPIISPPSSSIRVTIVASTEGMKPFIKDNVAVAGIPLQNGSPLMKGFIPSFFIEHFHAHAPNGFSRAEGRCPLPLLGFEFDLDLLAKVIILS